MRIDNNDSAITNIGTVVYAAYRYALNRSFSNMYEDVSHFLIFTKNQLNYLKRKK